MFDSASSRLAAVIISANGWNCLINLKWDIINYVSTSKYFSATTSLAGYQFLWWDRPQKQVSPIKNQVSSKLWNRLTWVSDVNNGTHNIRHSGTKVSSVPCNFANFMSNLWQPLTPWSWFRFYRLLFHFWPSYCIWTNVNQTLSVIRKNAAAHWHCSGSVNHDIVSFSNPALMRWKANEDWALSRGKARGRKTRGGGGR